jgi:hypothetical protein
MAKENGKFFQILLFQPIDLAVRKKMLNFAG